MLKNIVNFPRGVKTARPQSKYAIMLALIIVVCIGAIPPSARRPTPRSRDRRGPAAG